MDKVSYALGIGIGRQLASMGALDLASSVSHRIHVYLPTSSRLLPAAGPIWTEVTPAR